MTCSKGHTAEQIGSRRGERIWKSIEIDLQARQSGNCMTFDDMTFDEMFVEICPLCYDELLRIACSILSKAEGMS